ncbi:DUF5994 family protein, partial [Streptomyces sp. NPDC059690]|uniref:DUF5994 family protein n=1 Tax=Streptomyces sp. NPDC059690 TaxID=3346907 RepID=UPI0036757F15
MGVLRSRPGAAELGRRRRRGRKAKGWVQGRRHDATPAARLALKRDGASRGILDGAWWPRSRDLLSELPALTDVLDPLWGR